VVSLFHPQRFQVRSTERLACPLDKCSYARTAIEQVTHAPLLNRGLAGPLPLKERQLWGSSGGHVAFLGGCIFITFSGRLHAWHPPFPPPIVPPNRLRAPSLSAWPIRFRATLPRPGSPSTDSGDAGQPTPSARDVGVRRFVLVLTLVFPSVRSSAVSHVQWRCSWTTNCAHARCAMHAHPWPRVPTSVTHCRVTNHEVRAHLRPRGRRCFAAARLASFE
jgi:hypothetical protein